MYKRIENLIYGKIQHLAYAHLTSKTLAKYGVHHKFCFLKCELNKLSNKHSCPNLFYALFTFLTFVL